MSKNDKTEYLLTKVFIWQVGQEGLNVRVAHTINYKPTTTLFPLMHAFFVFFNIFTVLFIDWFYLVCKTFLKFLSKKYK